MLSGSVEKCIVHYAHIFFFSILDILVSTAFFKLILKHT